MALLYCNRVLGLREVEQAVQGTQEKVKAKCSGLACGGTEETDGRRFIQIVLPPLSRRCVYYRALSTPCTLVNNRMHPLSTVFCYLVYEESSCVLRCILDCYSVVIDAIIL